MKDNVANKILRGLKEFTDALERDEVISEKFTCRKVTLDLQPMAYTPKAVKDTRKILKASQAVFAQFLGVKPSAVRSWEQGRQAPSDMACRFLDEIQRNPDYWRTRLRESIRVKEAC
jgi:DNA-binding transcriptional regulator YiaG